MSSEDTVKMNDFICRDIIMESVLRRLRLKRGDSQESDARKRLQKELFEFTTVRFVLWLILMSVDLNLGQFFVICYLPCKQKYYQLSVSPYTCTSTLWVHCVWHTASEWILSYWPIVLLAIHYAVMLIPCIKAYHGHLTSSIAVGNTCDKDVYCVALVYVCQFFLIFRYC